jgi:succinyl-diaminopimelate desuccinylase
MLYDPLEIAKELIRLDSRNPPGITVEVVEYIESIFSEFKTKVIEKEEGKPNLIIEISSGKPELMLTSHMDTVPSPDALLNPVVVDGRLYGRGACDAKGCVAAIISALPENEPDFGLKFVFTSDEEVGGVNGLGYVFEKERSDFVLIGEPFGSDRIGILQAAVVSADIMIKGSSGHTATKDAKDGAIYRASKYIMNAVERFSSLQGDYSNFMEMYRGIGLDFELRGVNQAVFNPAVIKGGIKRNVVAPECLIEADVRFMPWINREEIRRALAMDEADFRINGLLQPYGLFVDQVDREKDLWFLEIIMKSIREKGLKPVGVCSLGVGDTRHVRKHGIPAFYYGPRGKGLHSENEYVFVEELYRCAEIIGLIIRAFGDGYEKFEKT